jgi:hypothetical protein
MSRSTRALALIMTTHPVKEKQRMSARWRGLSRVTVGLVVGLTLLGVAFWRGQGPPAPVSQVAPGPGPGAGYPLSLSAFPGAQVSTLDAARAAMGGTLPVPNSSDAPIADIQNVWLNASAAEVDIHYSTGLRLLLQTIPGESQDVIQTEDEAAVKQNGGASQLATIDGVPAVVTARDFSGNGQCGTPGVDCFPPQQNPSDVTMILNGVSVELTADWPVDQLVAVANTVSPSTAS